MSHSRIAFIGAGKIASALIGGLLKAGHPATHIWASGPSLTRLQAMQARFGITVSQENSLAAANADTLVLAVEPALIAEVLNQLKPIITVRQPLVISVAAGITETAMSTILGADVAVIRSMPNTPALIGHGMTVLYAKKAIQAVYKLQAEAIFKAVGATLWVEEESQINAITALSGSGPAYFFLLMEAVESAGIALGLSADIAHQLTVQTVMGSAYMAAASGETFHELRKQLVAKGGGTEQALKVLESAEFSSLVLAAMTAAKLRYEAMG